MNRIFGHTVYPPTASEVFNNGAISDERIAEVVKDFIVENPELGTGADGQSAYDIAVEQGFEGDQKAWLDSLKGEQGKSGADGISIIKSEINNSGELVVSYSNDTSDNVGVVVGSDGQSGIYVGSGDMPEGYDIQIDPDAEVELYSLTEQDKRDIADLAENNGTIRIPAFEDIDNTPFKHMITKCAESWLEAAKGTSGVKYQSLSGSNMGTSVNPMLYATREDDQFTSTYRDIWSEVKNTNIKQVNCITLANMIIMGIPYEHSRLNNHENVIGSMGYAFDVCKYIDSTKDTDTLYYNPNKKLDITTFEKILTQASFENTYKSMGLVKYIKMSPTSEDGDVWYDAIRPGDILTTSTSPAHTLICIDVVTSDTSTTVHYIHAAATYDPAIDRGSFTFDALTTNKSLSRIARPYYTYLAPAISISTSSGTVSDEQVQNAVNSYFDNNPIIAEESDPTVPSWAKDKHSSTYGQPRSLSMSDYFSANKKVVFIGDGFTQGFGSSECVSYRITDGEDSNISVVGNGAEYGVLNNLTDYEVGKKLWSFGNRIWYEALDGNGYAHRLMNYLKNKFGCTAKNYGMSEITTNDLLSQSMNTENSDLLTIALCSNQDDWVLGGFDMTTGKILDNDGTKKITIRTKTYIDLTTYAGDIVVSTSDAKFRAYYYDENDNFISATTLRTELTLDKTAGSKVRLTVRTIDSDISKYSDITITAKRVAENESIAVIEGLTDDFDTVFLTIGGNDRSFEDYKDVTTEEIISAEYQFSNNLSSLVEYLVNTANKKVILMSMTPCADDDIKRMPMSVIDEIIEQVAAKYTVPFVSCYNGMLDYCRRTGIDINTLRADDLHLNDEGHAVVNSIICEALGINEVDKSYVDEKLGDIDLALDELHAYAQALISGGVE